MNKEDEIGCHSPRGFRVALFKKIYKRTDIALFNGVE